MTDVKSDVPIPEQGEEKPKRTRKRAVASPESAAKRARKSKKGKANAAVSLIRALKFVAVAQKKAGDTAQRHCFISGHWAAASNGVLTVATKIEEDLQCCPDTYDFLAALERVGDEVNITQLSPQALSVLSGKFRAVIECADPSLIRITPPDGMVQPADDRIKAALGAVAYLATETAPQAKYAGVLLQPQTTVATNGAMLLEYWHGLDMPGTFLMPKSAALAVAKVDTPLIGVGCSATSLTFWFEDESFIKTQLFAEPFPGYHHLFDVPLNPMPVPEELFDAIKIVNEFSPDGVVWFKGGRVLSHYISDEASSYVVEGVPDGMGFNSSYMLMGQEAFKRADFKKDTNAVYFYGDVMRGVLKAIEAKPPVEETVPFEPMEPTQNLTDDDIPF